MGKILNLIGLKFNSLEVIDREGSYPNGDVKWKCKCDCGNIFYARGYNLKSGKSSSCGCKTQEKYLSRYESDLKSGDTFGKLTLMYPTNKRSKNRQIYWHCVCDCGSEIDIISSSLRNGNSKSCGCLKSAGELEIATILQKNNIFFESQKKYDDLIFQDTGHFAFYDFFVNNSYLIEFDGEQHFKSIELWGGDESFNKIKEHDYIKNEYCKQNNIPLIRIPYTIRNNIVIEDLQIETSKYRVV